MPALRPRPAAEQGMMPGVRPSPLTAVTGREWAQRGGTGTGTGGIREAEGAGPWSGSLLMLPDPWRVLLNTVVGLVQRWDCACVRVCGSEG